MDEERAKQIILELKEHCTQRMDDKKSCSECVFATTDKVCIFRNNSLPNWWRMMDLPNIKK